MIVRNRQVIVGGGVATAAAAAQLRSDGYDGAITIVSEEDSLPYERPPLSKEFLYGATTVDAAVVHDAQWYADREIELLLGVRAESIDVPGHRLTLAGGEGAQLDYDGLILATGGSARRLPGIDGHRVFYLRTASDARELHARLVTAERVIILGGGFIGCEVAASVVRLGKRAVIVERSSVLLERAVGPTIGSVLTDVHRAEGVEILTGSIVLGVREEHSTIVVQTNHGAIDGDLLVVGAGATPRVELAEAAGIDVDNGILTDEYLRTSAPDVYAVGDAANVFHPHYGRRIRVEHQDTAIAHGSVAGSNAAGVHRRFDGSHWFWSDQYEHSLQQAGQLAGLDNLVIRGSLDDLSFSAFSLRGGRIQAVVSLNRAKDVLDVRRLMFGEHHATDDELQDESVPIKRLAARPIVATR